MQKHYSKCEGGERFCYNCKRFGHFMAECPVKNPVKLVKKADVASSEPKKVKLVPNDSKNTVIKPRKKEVELIPSQKYLERTSESSNPPGKKCVLKKRSPERN